MSAIDSKNKIQLLNTHVEKGVSRKTGMPFEIAKGQCVVHTPEGLRVGVLRITKELIDTAPGEYLAEFALGLDYENNLVPRIVGLHPFGGKTLSPAAAAGAK